MWLARLTSAAVRLAPPALAVAAGVAVGLAIPHTWPSVLWVVVPAGAALALLAGLDRACRRLIPLPWLLRLTLVFPDAAPSRIRVALQAGSTRNLTQAISRHDAGLADRTPAEAAAAILVLLGALARHDRGTRRHSERVRACVDLLAEQLRLPQEDAERLRWTALVHDIGKLEVHPSVLNKPDPLDDFEWAFLQRHPEVGAKLVEPLESFLGEWADAVGQHHERWDGQGYPAGLAGEDICLGARIVAVADSFEVMTSNRAYSRAVDVALARAEILRCSGAQFDPGIVRALLSISLHQLKLRAPLLGAGTAALTASLKGPHPPVSRAHGVVPHPASSLAAGAAASGGHHGGSHGGHGSGYAAEHHQL